MIPGNSHLMKLLSPERLHNIIVKENMTLRLLIWKDLALELLADAQTLL